MCDAVQVSVTDKLYDEVVALITKLRGSNGVFTAYDVTKQLRQANPTMQIPHNKVREYVRNLYHSDLSNDYSCTPILLKSNDQALVYHPDGVDPNTHPMAMTPSTDSDSGSSDTDTDTDTTVNDGSVASVSDKETVALTVEKRLNVSRTLLSKLGVSAGKLVKVSTVGGVMSLTSTQNPSGTVLVVNADGRLRISERTLTNELGKLHKEYEMEFSNGAINVTPKPENN